MKNILLAVCLLCSYLSWSQNGGPSVNDNTIESFSSFEVDRSDLGRAKEIKRNKNVIEGYKHIWKEWNQQGVVISRKGKKYKVDKINFNAQSNWIEVRVHPDSTFVFNRLKIKEAVIDGRKFINVDFTEQQRVYTVELIAETNAFLLVKKYDVEVLVADPNPMRGTTRDKYKVKYNYFLKQGDKMEKFKPKKSKILKLLGDKSDKVAAYAKSNKLSYSDDLELGKIVKYANSL